MVVCGRYSLHIVDPRNTKDSFVDIRRIHNGELATAVTPPIRDESQMLHTEFITETLKAVKDFVMAFICGSVRSSLSNACF